MTGQHGQCKLELPVVQCMETQGGWTWMAAPYTIPILKMANRPTL